MAKDTTSKPPEIHIDSRSGDKPGEILGHVVPGKDLRQRMGLAPKSEVPPEKKEDKLPDDAPVTVVPAAPPKDEKTGKFVKKPKTMPAAPAVDPESLSAAVVAGVKAALPEKEKPAAPAAVDPLAGMKPAQKRKYSVLKQMGESEGGDKGLADKWLNGTKALAQYQSEWEAKHRGKKFDINDDEHTDFVNSNDVQYDLDEFADAEQALIEKRAGELADERAKAALKPIEERMKKDDDARIAQEELAKVMPAVVVHAKTTAKVLFDRLGENYKKVLDAGGNVDRAEVDRLVGENDINNQVFQIASTTETVAGELMKLAKGVVTYDDKSPLHLHIAQFAINQDAEMAKMPEEQQQNEKGQMFATMDVWNKLTPKQRESRWHLTDTDLSALYAVEQADRAKKLIADDEARFTKLAEKRGLVKNGAPAPAAPPARATTPARQPEDRSPSGAVAAIAPKTAQVDNSKQNGNNSLLKRMTG